MSNESQLDLYRQTVKKILDEGLGTRIDNETDDHAAVLIDELIRHAEYEVDIFCQRFATDIWGRRNVLDSLIHAAEKGVGVKLLTQEKPEDSESLDFIRNYDNAEVRIFVGDLVEFNFMIVDSQMFRIEPDNSTRHGFAYAQNSQFAKMVDDTFISMWKMSVQPIATKDIV